MVDVGDVFAVPLGEAQFVLCRVLAAEKPRGTWDRNGRWRVASCEWVGPASRIPAALASAEKADPNPGAWQWVATRVRAELEFRKDPDAVRAAWAAERKRDRKSLAEARASEKARKARVPKGLVALPAGAPTLAQLARRRPLTGWRRGKAEWIGATREVLVALVQQLIARPARSAGPVVTAVARATRALNEIDAAHEHPYGTTDAEALVEALVTIGVAAGVDEDAVAIAVDEARAW